VTGNVGSVCAAAEALCAPASGVAEDELCFFIVNGVLSLLRQGKGPGAVDTFVKFGALLVRCAVRLPSLRPVAIGAVADALGCPASAGGGSAAHGAAHAAGGGCLLAPSPSLPWGSLGTLDKQAFAELGGLGAMLMHPLCSLVAAGLEQGLAAATQGHGVPPTPPWQSFLVLPTDGAGGVNAVTWLDRVTAACLAARPAAAGGGGSGGGSGGGGGGGGGSGGGGGGSGGGSSPWLEAPALETLCACAVGPVLRLGGVALWRLYGDRFERSLRDFRVRVLRPHAALLAGDGGGSGGRLAARIDALMALAMEAPAQRPGGARAAWRGPLTLDFADEAAAGRSASADEVATLAGRVAKRGWLVALLGQQLLVDDGHQAARHGEKPPYWPAHLGPAP